MDLSQFLSLNNLPTGRRLFAHRKVLERADKSTMKDVVAHVKKSIKHDEETLQVELDRRGAPVARFSADATRLDVLLDRSITGLDSFFESWIRIYGVDEGEGADAAKVRKTVFPTGVGDITSLPYIQEDAAVAAILERMDEASIQKCLDRLPGADKLIAKIAAIHADYHKALQKEDDAPSKETMRKMQYQGQQYVYGTAILILGYYVRTGDAETTTHVMDPIRRQVQDLREARRRRRPVVDVDPDTGEPDLPANDEPEPGS